MYSSGISRFPTLISFSSVAALRSSYYWLRRIATAPEGRGTAINLGSNKNRYISTGPSLGFMMHDYDYD